MAADFIGDKGVYVINDRPVVVIEKLGELGFKLLVGDGSLDDAMLADCWALYPGRSVVTEEVLDKAPNLKLIFKQGVGLERINIDACTKRGICVANTPNSNYISVAEHTMALMLAVSKQLYAMSIHLRVKRTAFSYMNGLTSSEIFGKTISIIGLGKIGLRVAQLAYAFGMNVVAYVRNPSKRKYPEYIKLVTTIDEAIVAADFLSLHVSGTADNKGLIGKRELEMMKRGAVILNTTRGFVIDEAALYDALVNKTIAGAGLDVFTAEPVDPSDPILQLENLVCTPHTAANTRESRIRADLECVKILTDFASGKKPKTAVN